MTIRIVTILAAAAFVAGLFAPPVSAQGRSRLERPGTFAIGGGGGYGIVNGESRYGLDFDAGGAYYFTLKYMVGRRTALSAAFQSQSYDWKGPGVDGFEPYQSLRMTTFEGHFLYYFARDSDNSTFLDVGLSIARPELRGTGFDTAFPGETLGVIAGLGTELFLRENWALDLNARGILVTGEGYSPQEEALGRGDADIQSQIDATGDWSITAQATIGLLYYVLK